MKTKSFLFTVGTPLAVICHPAIRVESTVHTSRRAQPKDGSRNVKYASGIDRVGQSDMAVQSANQNNQPMKRNWIAISHLRLDSASSSLSRFPKRKRQA